MPAEYSPGHFTRKELPRYWTLKPKALRSRLAIQNPHTAQHYAEVIALAEQKLGRPGFDQYGVRNIIRSYANLIDLRAEFGSDDLYRGPQTVKYTKIRHSR
jgi:hypothetical protein